MSEPESPQVTPPPRVTLEAGRCHWCGYELRGLPKTGACPECGTAYTPTSAARLKPWPSVLHICLRLGWPLIGLAIVGVFDMLDHAGGFYVMVYGYPMLVAVPISGYFAVRSLLKRHLPEQKRTQGPIAVWRSIGTVVAILAFVLTITPCLLFGACLVMISGNGW